MATNLSVTHDDIYREVRAFLLGLFSLNGEQVIRGYSNNVPLPNPPFVLMNILNERRVATNAHNYSVEEMNAEVMQTLELQMQIDFYGDTAGEMAKKFTALWRDEYACEELTICQPLHADEARYMPFTNEESNYEERWLTTVYISYNTVLTHQQSFITNATISINKI